MRFVVLTRGFLAVVLLVAASCERAAERAAESPSPEVTASSTESPSPTEWPSPTESPSPTASPSRPTATLELRPDGLGDLTFGQPMKEVLPALVELLGEPVEDNRVHGDMPFGFDGMSSTARVVNFGGLYVLFGDWAEYAEAGTMHLVGWGASVRRTANGTLLATPERIRIGSSVADLEAAFGASLHLPEAKPWGCEGPPWYFGVDPDPERFTGNLTAAPTDPNARVQGLRAGSLPEGVWVSECW